LRYLQAQIDKPTSQPCIHQLLLLLLLPLLLRWVQRSMDLLLLLGL
jgi:hypothetical protein